MDDCQKQALQVVQKFPKLFLQGLDTKPGLCSCSVNYVLARQLLDPLFFLTALGIVFTFKQANITATVTLYIFCFKNILILS